MPFDKFKISKFFCLNYSYYLTDIFKYSFSLINLIKEISYIIQHFISIKLILCYMHKMNYYLYAI